jgi:uncharacterized repeat protein (TIGR01451 family)
VVPAAGENQANMVYDARFSFISTMPGSQQRGLLLTVSPDDYHGARMSWVALEDTADGIKVSLSDAPEADGRFRYYEAGVFDREQPHAIRFWIKVNAGPDNDLMRVFIDGTDVGQCFTTWENYYWAGGPPPAPPLINSLQFRSSVPAPSLEEGRAGYLFDNVTATVSSGADVTGCSPPPEPDIEVDKTTHTQSAAPGDLITYRLSVRNRGDAPVHALRACDLAPRALQFVGATRRLERAAGRRRCLLVRRLEPGQRRTFSATFRLREGVTTDSVTNAASAETLAGSAPSAPPPERPGAKPRRRVHGRDAATIKVQRRPRPCAAAVKPRARAAC